VKVYVEDQRSDAWRALRAGMLTGSSAVHILATRKRGTGELAGRRELRRQLVCERLTGQPADETRVTAAMQRGIDKEPDAFAAYEAAAGVIVKRCGFVAHDTLAAGCSPDGYTGAWAGLVELKCPASTTHLDYLRGGVVPEEYLPQLIHNLWITGAQWADFVSYDDRFPAALKLFRVRVWSKSIDFRAYELSVRTFLTDVEAEVADVLRRVHGEEKDATRESDRIAGERADSDRPRDREAETAGAAAGHDAPAPATP